MTRFVIPVQWMMTAEVIVEAKTRDEAIRLVSNRALPTNGIYLNNSFQISDDPEANERASLLSAEPIALTNPSKL